MSVSRRQFLSVAGGSAAGLFLAGCAGNTSGSSNSPHPSARLSGSGTMASPALDPNSSMTHWVTFPNTAQSNWYKTNVIDAFNAQSKIGHVKEVLEPLGNFPQLMQVGLTAGNGPDLVIAGLTDIVKFNQAGYLVALDDVAQTQEWSQKFQPWALDLGRVDGKLMWLPAQIATMFVFYSPSVFAKYGWTFPTNRSEFEALCADAAGRGITPIAAGNADYQAATDWHSCYYLNHVAGPEATYQALTGQIRWTDPVFVDAFTQFEGYMKKGWYGGSASHYFTNKFNTMYSDLAAGKAAMLFTGSWGLAEIAPFFGAAAKNDATWDWKICPPLGSSAPSDVWQLAVGTVDAISSKSKVPELTGSFIDYSLANIPLASAGLADVGIQPAPIKIAQSDFPATTDPRTARVYTGLGNASTIGYTTWTFLPGAVDTYNALTLDKVFAKKTSVQDYLKGLDDLYQPYVKKGTTLPVPKPVA